LALVDASTVHGMQRLPSVGAALSEADFLLPELKYKGNNT
jgi:hypothetical protein